MPSISRVRPGQPTMNKGAIGRVGIMDRITDMKPASERGLKINVYGVSGSGKTTFWSSFPGNILVCLCSGSDDPGELRSVDTPELRERVKQVIPATSQDVMDLAQGLRNMERNNTMPFDTVVLDHLTGLQDLTMTEILKIDRMPTQKSWGMASRDQWGQSSNQCKDILRALYDLRCNVIIVGQERINKEEGDSELLRASVGTAVTPSVSTWLYPATDYIVQTFLRPKVIVRKIKKGTGKNAKVVESKIVKKDEADFCMRTAPHAIYTCKFRVPKGYYKPPFIIDPDYDQVMSIIQGTWLETYGQGVSFSQEDTTNTLQEEVSEASDDTEAAAT